jgi:HlyD family secretion protein
MPAMVLLQTSERTLLSYLMKPLADQIDRAFREK